MRNGRFSALRTLSRRSALRGLGAASLLAGCGGASDEASLSVEEIDADSVVIRGAGSNVFATRTGEGALLVDTGAEAEGEALVRALGRALGGAGPAVAFNTHWHYENTGGNAAVKAAGAKIVSQENTRLWLQGDFDVPWQERHYEPRPEAFWPTETFHYGGGEAVLGGRSAAYRFLQRAHTDGDIVVHLADADVICAGDIVSVGAYPVLDWATGGWIGDHARALEALVGMAGPATTIVPAFGPVVDKAHLEAQLAMITTVRERLYEFCRQGLSVAEMLEAKPTAEFDAVWGDPVLLIENSYPGLWAHAGEIGRVV